MSVKDLLLFFVFSLAAGFKSIPVYAQKYFFQHYDIENGLIQSQVTSITQDRDNQLWISTFGGINCFDSKEFRPFTVEDGLPDNENLTITSDRNGQIWSGNSSGLTQFDQTGIKNYPFPGYVKARGVRQIMNDIDNNKWALTGWKLYRLDNGKLIRQFVTADTEMVTAIQVNKEGNLFAAVYSKGIYKLQNKTWRLVFGFGTSGDREGSSINSFIFDDSIPDKIYFISSRQVFSFANGRPIAEIGPQPFYSNQSTLACLLFDNEGALWIGSTNGAYRLKNKDLTFFNETNGFSSTQVICMFKDVSGNLWFGTDGAGLYQYPPGSPLIYDKTQGFNNSVVTELAVGANGGLFISTDGTGLFSFKGNKVSKVDLAGTGLENKRINCLYTDTGDTLWIGSDYSELWKIYGKTVLRAFPKKGEKGERSITAVLKDRHNSIWLATGKGVFHLEAGRLEKIEGMEEYCTSLLEIGKDSIVAGTETGIKLIREGHLDPDFRPGIRNTLVLCLQAYKGFLIAGTNDRGLYLLNSSTLSVEGIDTKQGLKSNSVLSMQILNDLLWVGTGRGVNKFILTKQGNHLSAQVTSFSGIFSECNENAMVKIGDYMSVGTTHGLNLYPVNEDITLRVPKTVIENIQTYNSPLAGQEYLFKNGYKLPQFPSLPAGQSHISIRFQAIDFNAAKTDYEYKLDGLDENYTQPIENNVVDYPNLQPGTYNFMVKTVMASGAESEPVSYRFKITPAYYQTTIFRVLVVLLFVLLLLTIFLYKTYSYRRKNIFISQLRQIEQENVRRQTAEDFHDDLGNKLTRVNMLSELLDKKIPPELTDQKKIVQQIRASVSEMYGGSRNILWALNPKNDRLGEIISEVASFGMSLFDQTPTSFATMPYAEDLNEIKVPLGYSHNLILIFKELINNILKHAQATVVTFSITRLSNSEIYFKIADDGLGYKTDNVFAGNGLKNIHNRSKKLKGKMLVESQPGKGTVNILSITLP